MTRVPKLTPNKTTHLIVIFFIVIGVAFVGIYSVLSSHAATPYASTETELGILSGSSSIQSSTTASDGEAVIFGTSPTSIAQTIQRYKEINYFPSDHAWANMWSDFDATEINSDFAAIQKLGGNVVRIIIDPYVFGWATPTATEQANLAQVFTMASAHDLKVHLTLFDEFGNYTETADSDAWINAVLTPYRNDPRLAYVELQNEIQPSDAAAMTWMQHEIPVIRAAIGSVPVTVSVTNSDTGSGEQQTVAQTLALLIPYLKNTPIDFYDIHYYGIPGAALNVFKQAFAEAGTTPVYVGETGASSWDGATSSGVMQESTQDLTVRMMEWAALKAGLPPAAPWILQDFPPGNVINEAASAVNTQNFFGLLRTDGTYKPLATSIQALYTNGTLSTDYNSDFTGQSGGLPLDWSTQDATQGTLAWDGTVGHDALGSASLSNTSSSSSAIPNFNVIPINNLSGVGQTVTDSVWAKGTNATGSNVVDIAWFDANGTYISNADSTALPGGTTNWTQLSVTATAPASAVYFQEDLKSADNSGTVWFDDAGSTVN
jgi:hypothetical protein